MANASSQWIYGSLTQAVPLTIFARYYFTGSSSINPFMMGLSLQTSNRIQGLSIRSTNKLAAGAYNNSYDQSVSGSNISSNAWETAAGAYAGAASRLVYLNGTAGTLNTTNLPMGTTPTTVGIGGYWWNGALQNDSFTGRLCEAAVWDTDLSAADLASLNKGFKPSRVRPQNLVFYAPLIRNIQDIMGGIGLTNANTATVTDHPRVY